MPETTQSPIAGATPTREQALKIFARSTFRELTNHGYTPGQVVFFTSELIGLISRALREPWLTRDRAP